MSDKDQDSVAIQYLLETEPERAWRPKEIADTLGFHGRRMQRLREILERLTREGVIVELRPGVYGLGKPADLFTGRLALARSGAGFVTDAGSGDSLRIDSDDVGTALPGDTVTVRRVHGAPERARGKIIRIVERANRDLVGTLVTTGRFLYVVPLDPIYRRDIVVPDAHGAREGDRVVVRFLNWPNRHVAPEGEIVEVIGPADKPSLDTTVVCRQYDLPGEFPVPVMRAAEHVAARLHQPGERLDLRDSTFILTVDPAKAKDFDDALSLERDARGRRVLGVHIADVSHFVQPGSPLDVEAYERGTSVYLVDKVIPMLPEQLSNGVCSLRPGEDRLCFTAFLTFDADGRMCGRRFAKTIIRSRLRLNYEQALAVLEQRKPEELTEPVPHAAVTLLRDAHELAQQLRRRRMRDGALDLEVPECEILLDGEARMTGVQIRPNDISHQLIEECMVAANEGVATELASRGIAILSRLHEPPDPLKIEELTAALHILGFTPGDLRDPRRLSRFLADTIAHPLRDHAHTLVLRSMKRAIYSAEAAGHFGLAKRYYSHFTSPIRRYPDLVLHRQLADYLSGAGRRGAMPAGYLKGAAERSTDREQRADDASRALLEIKKFRFLQQQLDDRKPVPYAAVVSRVTNFGLFVDVGNLQLTGLVHITSISDQFVRFNPADETLSVAGQRYRLGDKVEVIVARVDFNQRRADFALTGTPGAARNAAGAGREARQQARRHQAAPGQRRAPTSARAAGNRQPGGMPRGGRKQEPRDRGRRHSRGGRR
ncbi:MAG: ribonuclease R [Kiritimatiellae bacterium]|nr:ribonuclease R [Kiritimatiellia bacterium]